MAVNKRDSRLKWIHISRDSAVITATDEGTGGDIAATAAPARSPSPSRSAELRATLGKLWGGKAAAPPPPRSRPPARPQHPGFHTRPGKQDLRRLGCDGCWGSGCCCQSRGVPSHPREVLRWWSGGAERLLWWQNDMLNRLDLSQDVKHLILLPFSYSHQSGK